MTEFHTQSSDVQWQGRLLRAGQEAYRYEDGSRHVHDKVWHPGAVTVVPYDDRHVWLVRQPRPASGLASCLEIPAGKRDRPDEPLLDLAKRELAEEIGKAADVWRSVKSFYPTPGFCDEHITLFAATGLRDVDGGAAPEDDEYLEVVPWPLADIAGAIEETVDGKTLIGLLWLARELRRS
ncbi:MAG TPA: NUDIX hydrolase [Solirubrobacteraceae bacterium]|nr:NUDIX hydrolase [Solirubrobacteraceae bacterium]